MSELTHMHPRSAMAAILGDIQAQEPSEYETPWKGSGCRLQESRNEQWAAANGQSLQKKGKIIHALEDWRQI